MKAYVNNVARMGAVLVLALAFGVMSAARAEAAFVAYICDDAACDGVGDVSVTDESLDDDLDGIPGAILFSDSVAGYEIVINTSQSKPVLASGMDLNYTVTNVVGGSDGTVWLYATDTDFDGPEALSGILGGTSDNGSVTAIICGGDDNDDRDPVNTAPCTFGTDNSAPAIAIALNHNATGNPYSLTIGVAVSLEGVGSTATGDLRVVPEPASLALLSMGLLGAGAAIRRRRQVTV